MCIVNTSDLLIYLLTFLPVKKGVAITDTNVEFSIFIQVIITMCFVVKLRFLLLKSFAAKLDCRKYRVQGQTDEINQKIRDFFFIFDGFYEYIESESFMFKRILYIILRWQKKKKAKCDVIKRQILYKCIKLNHIFANKKNINKKQIKWQIIVKNGAIIFVSLIDIFFRDYLDRHYDDLLYFIKMMPR